MEPEELADLFRRELRRSEESGSQIASRRRRH